MRRAGGVPLLIPPGEQQTGIVLNAIDALLLAGGGDIDAGAEVMQNMMTNLEEGGEISEESQGAQGMYNQQQMLQSRMA